MGHFTAAKSQGNLDLVAFLEEPAHRAHLNVVVVIVDAGAHLDLLQLDHFLVLAGFGGFLLFLVFEFAVVHDFADRRVRVRRNLHQVDAGSGCALERIGRGDNTDVCAGLVDQSNFAGPDQFVDLRTFGLALLVVSCSWTADVRSPQVASGVWLVRIVMRQSARTIRKPRPIVKRKPANYRQLVTIES